MSYGGAILLFLAGACGNAFPVLANKIPWLNNWITPLDFGFKLRGRRLFGDNKTWRGLVSGTIAGGLAAVIIFQINKTIFLGHNPFIVGAVLAFGALVGDAIESSIKRQLDIKPGHVWFPFDQIDYIVGGLIFGSLIIQLSLGAYLSILITYFLVHLLASYLGFKSGLKNKPI